MNCLNKKRINRAQRKNNSLKKKLQMKKNKKSSLNLTKTKIFIN